MRKCSKDKGVWCYGVIRDWLMCTKLDIVLQFSSASMAAPKLSSMCRKNARVEKENDAHQID